MSRLGFVLLAVLGIVAMWLRDVPAKLFAWAKHFVVTTLTVDSRDELLFPALIEYMDSRDALRRHLDPSRMCLSVAGSLVDPPNSEG